MISDNPACYRDITVKALLSFGFKADVFFLNCYAGGLMYHDHTAKEKCVWMCVMHAVLSNAVISQT